MIPETQTSFRIEQSSLIGMPSPTAIKSRKLPGVRMGTDPRIGNHCIIFGNVFIGNRFRCGDNVFIRDNTAIGDDVAIGDWSFIDRDVVVGNKVMIGEEVWIPRTTRIDNLAVVGPRVKFLTESITPWNKSPKGSAASNRGIILEEGCIIGMDAVICPGVCIGAGAVIEEGTVVTEDVPADMSRKIPS